MHRARLLAAALLVTALGATPALADEIAAPTTTASNDAVVVEATVNQEAAAAEVDQATVDEATLSAADDEGVSTLAADDIEKFVTRMYTMALGRAEADIDAAGFKVQVSAMRNGMPAAQIAMNFFTSEEFTNRGLDNGTIVETVYRAMFDRAADTEGKALWVGYLDNYMSVASIVKGFSESEEYATNCAKWGVTQGSVEVTEARDISPLITEFACGLYTHALGRVPDIAGLNVQCQALLDGVSGSAIARNFFNSEEYTDAEYTNKQMVETVYETMLGRGPDTDGFAFWKGYLDAGASIDAVVCGFSEADEWVDYCADHLIIAERLTPVNERDKNIDVTRYVHTLFNCILNRDASASETEERCKYLNEGRAAASMVAGFYESDEFTARGLGATEIIDSVWTAMVGGTPTSDDYKAWNGFLSTNTAKDMAIEVSKTNEFKNLCKRIGITCGYANDPYDGAYQSITSTTNCFILVDTIKNQLVIYEGSQNNWNATHVWSCATGAPGTETVKGTFTVTGLRGEYFDDAWGDRCWYYTQFSGDYLIHSVLYEIEDEPNTIKDGTLGANVSHGCVRLDIEWAKWVYDYVPTGSTVFVF